MKRLFLFGIGLCFLLGQVGALRADIIGYETFRYRAGAPLEGAEGGAFWDFDNNRSAPVGSPAVHTGKASDWEVLFGATALSGGKLFTAEGGVSREYSGITEGIGSDEGLGYFDEGSDLQTIYYQVDMTRGTDATWCGLSSFSFEEERLFFGLFPDGTGKFSIYDQRTFTRLALSTQDVTVGQKFTMVVRMDINTLGGLGSQLRIYLNPNVNAPENPASAVASAVLPGRNPSTALRLASGGGGLVEWDNLLVTTTWDSLRVEKVTSLGNAGTGSLREVLGNMAATGGRVQFPAAEWMYAVTDTNQLLRFSRHTPGTVTVLPVTGLLGGERLVACEFAENTGGFYAMGYLDPAGADNGQGRLYLINLTTGVASLTNVTPFSSTLRNTAGAFGMAWEPGAGQLRVVSAAGDHLRLNLNGVPLGTGRETPLAAGASAGVTAIAWGPDGGAGRTLYGVDLLARLVRIGGVGGEPSPNGGEVTVVGPLGAVGFGTYGGFDITEPGVAWATSEPGGLARLNRINLTTGVATQVGSIGTVGYDINGMAAAPESIRLTTSISLPETKAIIVEGPEEGGLAIDGGGSTRLFALGFNGFPKTKALVAFRDLTLTGGLGFGGAIYLQDGTAHLDNCTVSGNQSTADGAIRSWGATLRLERCTFTGNTAAVAAAVDATNLRMIHCTVSGNRATRSAAGGVQTGAVVIDASTATVMPVIIESLIAGNTAPVASPPDLSVTGTAEARFSLIGVGDGSGIGNGALGSRVGTLAAPLAARLAPAAYYGGGQRTMPPLPDSLAVNLVSAGGLNIRLDQRGLPANGNLDAGAAEYQGTTDLAQFWKQDWDRDGVPFGMEFAVGTDALRPDRNSPDHLAVQFSSGTPAVTFRVHDPARPHVRWVVRRSLNLSAFTEEIYSFNGRTALNTVAPGIFQGSAGSLVLVRDQLPNPLAAFYRLEAELLP